MRNFTNKLWNAARFVTTTEVKPDTSAALDSPSVTGQKDQEFTDHLNQVIVDITKQLDELKLGLAADTIYNEFWHWYCDVCIEEAKQGLISREKLMAGLLVFIQLLHPFVPFVTEAVWQEVKDELRASLPQLSQPDLLMVHTWPKPL
jgi:valyl-tRNA synthetase